MGIDVFNIFGSKSKSVPDEEWQRMKDVVDAIFRATDKERKKMDAYDKHYMGNMWNAEEMRPHNTKGFINLFFSTVQSIAPMLTDAKPITSVVPRWQFMSNVARMYNNGLKYIWEAAGMQMQILKAVLDAMVKQLGIFHIYFDPDKKYGGDIVVETVDPRHFFVAPGYDEIWKAPMCGTKQLLPMSWVRRHFPDIKELKPESSPGTSAEKQNAFKYGDAADFELENRFVTVYEVWLKDDQAYEYEIEEGEDEKKKRVQKYPNGKFMYFTTDQFLGCFASPYDHGLPPYVELHDYVVAHNLLGMGEGNQIAELDKELNRNFARLVDYAAKYHDPNLMIDEGAGIDIETVKQQMQQGGNAWAWNSTLSMGKGRPVEPVQLPMFNPAVLELIRLISDNIEEISGATDVSKGITGKKERQSASEIAVLSESSQTRTRQRVRNLEWSLSRVAYLLIRLMQQNYEEPRQIHWKDGDATEYAMLGNSKAQAREMIMPNPEMQDDESIMPGTPEDKQRERERRDLEEFLSFYEEDGDLDPIYFDFDIEVQTNSTLPMDKQSLANLALRLAQLKVIDPKALLEVLQFPRAEEIAQRIEQKEKQMMAAKQGGPNVAAQPRPQAR